MSRRQVGSVVSVEWPSKGGRPFKGCLTKVCYGEGGGAPTVSVIYEDTDTEVSRMVGVVPPCPWRLFFGALVRLARPL